MSGKPPGRTIHESVEWRLGFAFRVWMAESGLGRVKVEAPLSSELFVMAV